MALPGLKPASGLNGETSASLLASRCLRYFAETAVRVYNSLRERMPLLQALAAASPVWFGVDSGLASARMALTRAYPGNGIQRASLKCESTRVRVAKVELDALVNGDAIPKITSSCEISIIAPIPHENPDTTAGGTRCAYLPSRRTQKTSMKMEATIEILAAPPMPCCLTAMATNGTVALAVPPISSGLRPSMAVTGPVSIEV